MNDAVVHEPPEPGRAAEVRDGILWIRLPIPGGLRHINVWLIPAQRGWFLVDTGMKTEVVERAWTDLDARLPLATDLQGIIVTHHHPDHYGMARWLSHRYEVDVWMAAASAMAADQSLESAPPGPPQEHASDGFVERLGIELDESMRSILRGGIYRSIVSGQVATTVLEPGKMPQAMGDRWRTTLHNGHAPGHACLHDDATRVLVSGDQVLPSISSNISLYPSNESDDPLGQYLESLENIARLPQDTLVLPAHGRPFASLHQRIGQLRDEHRERLEKVMAYCSVGRSTQQVASELFRFERLDALNRLLAVTETLAHLRWLEIRGQVRREGAGAALRWQAC